jgi:DNA polymerase-1
VRRAEAGDDVLIVSSDKDFAQLVGERIRVLLPPPSAQPRLGWRLLDAAGVREKFGVGPERIVDYLALIGDTSDNIPGLNGVGPKTAIKWLERHGDLEGILAAAATVEPERFRAPLVESAERLRLNRRLVTLNLTHALPPLEQIPADLPGLTAFLAEMEMRTTLAEARERYGQPELF